MVFVVNIFTYSKSGSEVIKDSHFLSDREHKIIALSMTYEEMENELNLMLEKFDFFMLKIEKR